MGRIVNFQNQFENNPNEQEVEAILEEMYLDYNVLDCPLGKDDNGKSLSRSMGGFFGKNNFVIPSEFLGFEQSLNEVKSLISKKTNKFSDDDYQAYLFWRIWQIKRANLNTVKSDKAKIRCLEVNDTMAKTLYKLQAKAEKLINKANNINVLEEHQDVKNYAIEITEKLSNLIDAIALQTRLSIETYPKLFEIINRPEFIQPNDPSLPF